MKHDEKKIKELILNAPVLVDTDNNYSFSWNEVRFLTKQYAEHMVQQRDVQIISLIEDNFEDENPMEDGVPVETYGYEAHRNQGFRDIINLINKQND